jgi:hypothetical protein
LPAAAIGGTANRPCPFVFRRAGERGISISTLVLPVVLSDVGGVVGTIVRGAPQLRTYLRFWSLAEFVFQAFDEVS